MINEANIKGKLNAKNSLTGKLNNKIIKEYPDIDDLNITPTNQVQTFTHENSYGYDTVSVSAIPSEYVIPTGQLEISENGNYNVKNYETANVNVSLGDASYAIIDLSKFSNWQNAFIEISDIDFGGLTSAASMFHNANNLVSIGKLSGGGSITNLQKMFSGCSLITEIDLTNFNTKKCYNFQYMFENCTSLTTIKFGNNVTFSGSFTNLLMNMFSGCSSLTENTLNSILDKITTFNSSASYKTLRFIGLSETQATTCITLSNWTAAQNAGWTTGY